MTATRQYEAFVVPAVRLIPAVAVVVALAGCGGRRPAAAPQPQLDPPQAAEPVGGPALKHPPRGQVVRVGAAAEGVAIDPVTHLAAVAVQSPDRLVLVDDRSGRVVREVPLPGSARHVSLARPGGPFLVPAETANQLVEVDPRTGRTRSTPVGDHPHDATAVGPRIFTADEFGATMTVVRDGRVVGTMPVDVQPGGIAAAGDRVAIVSVRAYDVELYDGRSDRPRGLGAQSGGLGPSHVVVGPDGRLVIAETLQICRTTDPPTIVLLAMPITSDEATFVARSGWRCFEERLASSSVNVFDSGRASVDGMG